MRLHLAILSVVASSMCARPLAALDKNGVAPSAISLPSGPGSIQGLGESFQPQLNSGSGSYQVPLALPKGTGGLVPGLGLVYNSGGGNGVLGLGWSLSGRISIRRNTDKGVPRYVDGPNNVDDDLDAEIDNPEELDVYTGLNGEELVPLQDGSFRAENESSFVRYARLGDGWEARTPDGGRWLFGQSASSRIEESGRVLEWGLERQLDRHGNSIEYAYTSDPDTPAQKYLSLVRWGQPAAYFGAVMRYETGRPDVATSYQSGFELRTSLRLSGIDIFSQGLPAPTFAERADFDGTGKLGALIRRVRLEYDPTSHLSLLVRVTVLGADGLTAMPALSFGYSQWTPVDDAETVTIRSRGAPAEAFNSPSVELIDMNGDGLPDLLSTSGNQHRVAINRGVASDGRLDWAPLRPVDNAPNIDLASDRTHLADATADGLSDLLVKVSNTSFLCFDNTSHNAWTNSPFPIRNTDTWPIWPYDGEGGKLSRSIDIDYNRSNDVLYTSSSGYQLWMFLPGGRFSKEVRLPPLSFEGQIFRFDLPGAHIADVNGDRLQDLVWIQSSRVVCFLSQGRGAFAAPFAWSLGRTLSAADIGRTGFSDVDGDGMVDLTLVQPSFQPTSVVYWLNRFDRGLEGPRAVRGLPTLSATDTLRWADINGNGTTDIVVARAQALPDDKIVVMDLVPEGKIHLLTSVDNGLGRRIELEYESSTAQLVRAEAAGVPWTSVMPVVTVVVRRIVERDGRSPPFDQSFTYRDPYYDAVKQEFRGFRSAEAHENGDASVAGKLARFTFDTGMESDCLKGKTLSEEVLGEDGKLFKRTVSSWSQRVLEVGLDRRQVCFAFRASSDEFIHEGEPEGIQLRQETDYDDFGNVVEERNYGMLFEEGDELFIERTFDLRPAVWLLRLPRQVRRTDGSGQPIDVERYFHNSSGDLERSESWLDTEDRFFPTLRQTFDSFGNVIETIDARGHRRTMEFDDLIHALAVKETIHLEASELVMSAEYDLGFGVATRIVDFHGQLSEYSYDALGRLVEQRRPGGAGELYEYQFGNPVSRVIKRLRLEPAGAGSATFDSYIYSDAYGRPIGSRVEGEDGRWRVLEAKTYNARKLESAMWLPYLSDTPDFTDPDPALPHESKIHDALGRLVESKRPDGSILRQQYGRLTVLAQDGNDTASGRAPDVRSSDGLGRLRSVEEHNGAETYVTSYGWRASGELESVVDALGNTRRYRFDSIGRLIEVDDPDRGLRRQTYDDAGNLVERVGERGQITRYSHDAINRILERDYTGSITDGVDSKGAVYHYDAPAGDVDFGDGTRGTARNVQGRLAWVEDSTGEEHFSYDGRGNIEWAVKRVRDPDTGLLVSYRTQQAYDLLNRESETIFADNDRIRVLRGAGGFVERIDGGPEGRVVLAEADFAPNGQPTRLRFGNGVESIFEYDSSQRLKTLRTLDAAGKQLLDESLGYDLMSNVTDIVDARPLAEVAADSPRRRTAQFVLDELNRLTRVTYGVGGALGRIDYTFDAIGNLLRQSSPPAGSAGHIDDPAVNLGDLSYAGGRSGREGRGPLNLPGPHALTSTTNGQQLAYDLGGNVTGLNGATLTWDSEDRLVHFEKKGTQADYERDHSLRRIQMRVWKGDALDETLYIDQDFEVENGAPIKYAFLDGRRLARITGVLDPTRERVQRIVLAAGWNLLAAAVESPARLRDAFGDDAAVYKAEGATYGEVAGSSNVPHGRALWVFVPSARLAVLRGSVPQIADVPSAGPLHAWPLLESFRPRQHVGAAEKLLVYNAARGRWLRRDASLPSFLNDAPADLGAARAFWSGEPVVLRVSAAAETSVVTYHQDHLGSPAVLTSATGKLLEERAQYPYGGLRSLHRPTETEVSLGAPGSAEGRWGFTGKERDSESGLVDMGARSYFETAGIFLSPDQRYAEVASLGEGGERDQASFAAFLNNPQMGNLYAYGVRNPLKFVDPSGLEIVFSPVLQKSPVFQEALALFKRTEEGQRLLAHIESSKFKVTLSAGKAITTDPKTGKATENLGVTWHYEGDGNSTIEINVLRHKADYANHDAMILELADTIHHELRHSEGNMNALELAGMRKGLDWIRNNALQTKSPSVTPADPTIWMGTEVHKALDVNKSEPLNVEFRKQADFLQVKDRIQKSGVLLEVDLD